MAEPQRAGRSRRNLKPLLVGILGNASPEAGSVRGPVSAEPKSRSSPGRDPGKRGKQFRSLLATCSRGMSPFVALELKSRLGIRHADINDGRVYFTTDLRAPAIEALRSVERVVCVVARFPARDVAFSACIDVNALADRVVQLCVSRGKKPWRRAVDCLRESDCDWRDSGTRQSPQTDVNTNSQKPPSQDAKSNGCNSSSARNMTRFYVNAKTTGTFRCKGVDGRDLGARLASALSKLLGWVPVGAPFAHGPNTPRNSAVEVYLHANDHEIVAGVPLFRRGGGLLRRSRTLKFEGLRPTIAWLVGSLAGIECGHRVVDPTSGVGTLLIEAARDCPGAHFVGGDINMMSVSRARANAAAAGLAQAISFRQWDAERSGLKGCADASFDRAVADLPFGIQHGTQRIINTLYPAILDELERVLKGDGLASLLTNQIGLVDSIVSDHITSSGERVWSIERRVPLRVGPIQAQVILIRLVNPDSEARTTRRGKRYQDVLQRDRETAQADEIIAGRIRAGVRASALLPRALVMRQGGTRRKVDPRKGKKRTRLAPEGPTVCSKRVEARKSKPKKSKRE